MPPSLQDFENASPTQAAAAPEGRYTTFLRALVDRTPTKFPCSAAKRDSACIALVAQWGGYEDSIAVQPDKGGTLSTTVIDSDLYVVWYAPA